MNLTDYVTKYHPAAHHRNMRKKYLTPKEALQEANLEETKKVYCYKKDPATFTIRNLIPFLPHKIQALWYPKDK